MTLGAHALRLPRAAPEPATIGICALSGRVEGAALARGVDDPDTQVLLDNGITGIVFPDVSTAAEARRAVSRARFAPSAAPAQQTP